MALHEAPEFNQDQIWQELEAGPSHAEPSLGGGDQSNSQQPIGYFRADRADFGEDPIWQDLEPGLMRDGLSHAGPSQGGPSQPAQNAPPELGDFVMPNGHCAKDYWVFIGQTATPSQIEMLRSRGVMPSETTPTTAFAILGVPHTAEWREGGFIRLTPSLDPGLLAGSREHLPSG
ncbi:hypothetical protein I6F35_18200 [Bradyrhizobium sp. BRP22]|uniref:hypothetical protein n=1 Tax=Bradyrhizobium sp. BRP22 TaxID=2793821 RepID=UPI001CD6CF4C|nr:hypothetical protein [Bradyrhizobium sp. BRP22]MCA1455140.1 hypothetical protein [Bradyrhizobium sp. BRP22]